jgi:hypothetical protein
MAPSEWTYDEGEWIRTRVVEVYQAADGMYYWRRSRIKGGVSGKVVAVSGGFVEEMWAYVSATKENYPLAPQPVAEPPVEIPEGDDPVNPDVPPGPEPGEPPVEEEDEDEDSEADEKKSSSKSTAKSTAKEPAKKK